MNAMFERVVKAGETVIFQGDEGDNFYVIEEGLFEVLVDGEKVVELCSGGSFGELALMYNVSLTGRRELALLER
jgi:cAMP-dependent protein kinase regulator